MSERSRNVRSTRASSSIQSSESSEVNSMREYLFYACMKKLKLKRNCFPSGNYAPLGDVYSSVLIVNVNTVLNTHISTLRRCSTEFLSSAMSNSRFNNHLSEMTGSCYPCTSSCSYDATVQYPRLSL